MLHPAMSNASPTVAASAAAALSVSEAVTKAKEEWHHYTHCLELVG